MDTPVLGTVKQADVLVRLSAKLRLFKSPDHPNQIRAEVLTRPYDEVDRIIQELNKRLGWSKDFSLASDAQRSWIVDLEKEVYGEQRTLPRDPLTWAEADKRIKYLKAEKHNAAGRRTETLAEVIDISSKRVS